MISTVCSLPAERFLKKWEENVFDFLLKEEKITPEIINNMESWKHSGFSVDNSVYVAKNDKPGMGRLIEYISRCPFSLARIIKITDAGKVLYRAVKSACKAFPILGNEKLKAGTKRNFEVFEPLDFLAEITQHIPNKGEHQMRYYGWYSNKQRGLRSKKAEKGEFPQNQKIKKRCQATWAMLIKLVYEVDPLKCSACGGEMKVVSFIERRQIEVIERILKHCNLWKDKVPRSPPVNVVVQFPEPAYGLEPHYDYNFFDNLCL